MAGPRTMTPRSNRNKNLTNSKRGSTSVTERTPIFSSSMHVNGYSTGGPHGLETWFTRERQFGDRKAVFATLTYAHLKEQLAKIGYVLPAEEERGVRRTQPRMCRWSTRSSGTSS